MELFQILFPTGSKCVQLPKGHAYVRSQYFHRQSHIFFIFSCFTKNFERESIEVKDHKKRAEKSIAYLSFVLLQRFTQMK